MELKDGYKIIDGKYSPLSWEETTIGEIAQIQGGGTPNSFNKKYWNGNIDWFTPTEIGENKYVYCSIRKITEEGLKDSSAKLLPINTILLTSRAGIGDASILKKEACTNQGFQSLISRQNVDFEFLYYVILTLKKVLEQNASGSTFLEISPKNLSRIKIALPPLPEQQAIVEVLSDTDNLIQALEKQIAKKRLIKQGAVQKLFDKSNWNDVPFIELCKTFTKQTGFDYSAYIKPTLENIRRDGTIPFIQNKDFNGKKINFVTDYYIPEDVAHKFPRILLDEKCLLISISGSIGNVGVFCNSQKAFIGGAVAVAKFKDKDYLDWVLYYMESKSGQDKLLKNVKAGSHQNLILEDIRNISIPLPSKEDQKVIVGLLSDIENELDMLNSKLAKCKLLKQGLMQNLLTGKIRLV